MIPKFRILIIFFHLQVKFRITVALALNIVSLFEGANSSLAAAVVVVTGLVGANFVQMMLDKLRFDDPIARGIATASSAHGLGTTALSAKEPEALPFCAIAYALTASTAAGSFVKGANFYGLAKGNARGGVPSARIAAC